MLSSPAKRRKTGETTAASVDASRANQQAVERNATVRPNRRPSFQSPTKASLARSHPDILARAMSRSPTRPGSRHGGGGGGGGGGGQERESRGGSRLSGLRDRKALRPSLTSNAGPPAEGLQTSPRRRPTVTAPERREGAGTSEEPESPRVPDGTTEGSPESELPRSSFLQQALEEPDLPPTPTELGLEPPPGRPKGLSSSSPSAQYEKRARRRIDDAPKPSPLKQRLLETDRGSGDDDDNVPEPGPATRESLPSGQSKEKKGLSAELQRLKDDVAELEAWTEMLDSPEEAPAPSDKELSRLVSLLSESASNTQPESSKPKQPPISSILSALLPFSTKAPPKPREESPLPTNPFALDENAQSKPYLTVFAPLALETHSTKVSTKADTLTETHQLTLTPGPPVPPKLYNATVIYEANPETQTLLSISVPDSHDQSNLPTSLRRWIDTRLSNPLLNLDVSGLCWGVNRYWEAALSRAQIWSRVESRYSHLLSRGHHHNHSSKENTDIRHLLPHLDRTTMTFSNQKKGASTSTTTPLGVLISCSLTLDEWTSEPRLLPEVSISAVPQNRQPSSRKMEQETKKLFYTLLKGDKEEAGSGSGSGDLASDIEVDAVVRAVDGVLGVLFGLDQEQQRVRGKLPVR